MSPLPSGEGRVRAALELRPDGPAAAWLAAHPTSSPRVIAYEVHRCCGGGKICEVRFREMSADDDLSDYTIARTPEGVSWLVDRRAATRLPATFGVTLRGHGRRARLGLELAPDQRGDL